jgi:mRNA interferase RelE/StbE
MNQKKYEVVFKKSALKELQNLPGKIRQKVLDAVQLLSVNPYTELLQIKKMRGADALYRFRINDYRVVYLIDRHLIKVVIIKIGHRKDVYG